MSTKIVKIKGTSVSDQARRYINTVRRIRALTDFPARAAESPLTEDRVRGLKSRARKQMEQAVSLYRLTDLQAIGLKRFIRRRWISRPARSIRLISRKAGRLVKAVREVSYPLSWQHFDEQENFLIKEELWDNIRNDLYWESFRNDCIADAQNELE